MQLGAEKRQDAPMDDVGGVEHVAAHAQKADMHTQSELPVVPASDFDSGDFGRTAAEGLFDLEFAQPGGDGFDPQKSQSPSLPGRLPRSDAIEYGEKDRLQAGKADTLAKSMG